MHIQTTTCCDGIFFKKSVDKRGGLCYNNTCRRERAHETLQTTTPKLENDTETKIEDKKNSQISK